MAALQTTQRAVLEESIEAAPLMDMVQFAPLQGIPGLLDKTISVVNEQLAAMQVRSRGAVAPYIPLSQSTIAIRANSPPIEVLLRLAACDGQALARTTVTGWLIAYCGAGAAVAAGAIG